MSLTTLATAPIQLEDGAAGFLSPRSVTTRNG